MITLDSKLIEREAYNVLKFKENRFGLKKIIHDYFLKKDEEKIFQSISDYLVIQHHLYNKIKETDENTISLLYASYFGAASALDTLNYNTEEKANEKINFFTDKKIDFKKKFPEPANDSLELLIRSTQETHPAPYLETLTQSFLTWLCTSSLEELSQLKRSEHPQINIKDKNYTVDFSQLATKDKSKSSFNLSNYASSAPKTPSPQKEKQIPQPNTPKTPEQKYPTDNPSLPSETFIHGHDNVKTEFKKITTILKPRDYFQKLLPAKELFHNYLLVGPPGTGKTTLINTLAQQCGLEFRSIPCADLCSKYFGESASNIQEIYTQARQLIEKDNAPGIILFFDEFDQIAGSRGNSPNDRERNSLVTTLNSNLDGTNTTPGILTFAATNVEQIIDPALLTRFQKLYIGYPKTDQELIGMHQTIIQKIESYAQLHNPQQKIFDSIDYSQILPFSKQDERYKSGRIINRLLHTAALENALTSHPDPLQLVTTSNLVEQYHKYQHEQQQNYTLKNQPDTQTKTI